MELTAFIDLLVAAFAMGLGVGLFALVARGRE